MNTKRLLVSWLAVFAFVFVYEWVFHGILLKPTYEATAHLWRPEAEMQQRFMWLMLGQLLLSVMFCLVFAKGYEGKGLMEGVRFGVIFWLVLAGPDLVMYAVAPYPPSLVIKWQLGGVIESVSAGVITAWLYGKGEAGSTS